MVDAAGFVRASRSRGCGLCRCPIRRSMHSLHRRMPAQAVYQVRRSHPATAAARRAAIVPAPAHATLRDREKCGCYAVRELGRIQPAQHRCHPRWYPRSSRGNTRAWNQPRERDLRPCANMPWLSRRRCNCASAGAVCARNCTSAEPARGSGLGIVTVNGLR